MERARNGDAEVTWIVVSHESWVVSAARLCCSLHAACMPQFCSGWNSCLRLHVPGVCWHLGGVHSDMGVIWVRWNPSIGARTTCNLDCPPKNVSCRLQGLKFQLSQVTLLSAACVIQSTRQSNLEVCLARIREIGYVAKTYLLDSQWYGLPQSRRRVYIVCLSTLTPDVSVSPNDFFQSVRAILQTLHMDPPPADTSL